MHGRLLNQDKFILVGIVFIIFMAFWHGISSRIDVGVRKKNDYMVAIIFACVYALFLIIFIFCVIGGVITIIHNIFIQLCHRIRTVLYLLERKCEGKFLDSRMFLFLVCPLALAQFLYSRPAFYHDVSLDNLSNITDRTL
jgi:hypothetical protein